MQLQTRNEQDAKGRREEYLETKDIIFGFFCYNGTFTASQGKSGQGVTDKFSCKVDINTKTWIMTEMVLSLI